MTDIPLYVASTVILDSNGNGVASVSPQALEMWNPAVVSVSSSGGFPQCNVYAGPVVTPSTFVDATLSGNNDSTSNIVGRTLFQGNSVFAVWTNGLPGASATIVVTGTKTTGYRKGIRNA